jgi:hypothetical protein
VAADDLNAPLGQTKKRSFKLPIALPQAIAGVLGLFLAAFMLWALVNDNPFGGEPIIVVAADKPGRGSAKTEAAKIEAAKIEAAKIEAAKTDPGKNDPAKSAAAATPGASASSQANAGTTTGPNRYDGPSAIAPVAPVIPPGAKTVTIIDGSSGKRQEVVLPGVPGVKSMGLDQRLTESTRHGLIPKIAPDGARAAEIYAQAAKPLPGKPDAPRIAIVVGGLGTSSSLTAAAITALPGPVTFAIAPYGQELDALVMRVRGAGHEVLLQVPMEPFDYPDNDPGPQTLLTSLSIEQNRDRLHWLMSRFQGYVGIVNYMGARFTATEQTFTPVLREIAKRGLIYFDDGTSPRSVASQIAGASHLPFARAGIVIDAVPTPVEIERALGRLESTARQHGLAIGMAHALPVSIDRIAKWAKEAEKRGVLLVPISAAAVKAKSS